MYAIRSYYAVPHTRTNSATVVGPTGAVGLRIGAVLWLIISMKIGLGLIPWFKAIMETRSTFWHKLNKKTRGESLNNEI